MENRKMSEAGRSGTKAAYIIKKYGLQRQQFGAVEYDHNDAGEFFFLNTEHPDFEKIIGRDAQEIFGNYGWCGDIPLGETAVDAVVSLYGLSNSSLYGTNLLCEALNMTRLQPSVIVNLFKAAAFVKYDAKHGSAMSVTSTLGAIEKTLIFQRIKPSDIVDEYRYLRG